jgi:hypothetical protein
MSPVDMRQGDAAKKVGAAMGTGVLGRRLGPEVSLSVRRLGVWLMAAVFLAAACSTSSSSSPNQPPRQQESTSHCSGAISWNAALSHIGETLTVEGPVVSAHYASDSNGKPTFLNVGKDYPDPGRFTVVIWGEDRGRFSSPPEGTYTPA